MIAVMRQSWGLINFPTEISFLVSLLFGALAVPIDPAYHLF